MSKIIKTCAFSTYYAWQKLDRSGKSIDTDHVGFTQPSTITIKHTVTASKISAYIVPHQAMYGPEWSLVYTIRRFKEDFIGRFHLEGHMIYYIFVKCLQGNACTVWDELMAEEYPADIDRTTEEFGVALTRYLENI